jgi:hypothetical protein
MIAGSAIDVFIYVFFLKIEKSTSVVGVAANKVLKRLVSHLCHQCDATVVFEEISYFECIHILTCAYANFMAALDPVVVSIINPMTFVFGYPDRFYTNTNTG